MPRATRQQFYYVIADPNLGEQDIKTKYSKCKSFQVKNDLLNSDNLRVAITQLCNELQVCNFTMLQPTPKKVNNIFKQNSLNAIVFQLQLIYSTVKM